MKILQLNKKYLPHIGGVETIVRDIAEGLQKRGWESRVLTNKTSKEPNFERINNVEVKRVKAWFSLANRPISLNLLFAARQEFTETDVIFLHYPDPPSFLSALLWWPRKPLFIWYHAAIVRPPFIKTILWWLARPVFKRAKCVFVSSNNLKKKDPHLLKFSHKIQTVPFGIDSSSIRESDAWPQVQEIRKHYSKPLILSVGRLVSYKGFEYLIRGMESIDAHLLIVGGGPLREKLLSLAKELGVDGKVTIIPHVEDVSPYYLACDVFVLPSISNAEAFGIVQLEAMLAGKPVINTDLPTGVPEVSIHEETGITVAPGDSQALSDAIRRLIDDRELRYRLGNNARNRVLNNFTKEIFIADVEKGLRECLDSGTM